MTGTYSAAGLDAELWLTAVTCLETRVMPEETDEIVGSLGRELVSGLAPEELPLYPSLLSQFQGAKRGRGGKKSSDDQLLGFGAAEAMTMLTPVILSFTTRGGGRAEFGARGARVRPGPSPRAPGGRRAAAHARPAEAGADRGGA